MSNTLFAILGSPGSPAPSRPLGFLLSLGGPPAMTPSGYLSPSLLLGVFSTPRRRLDHSVPSCQFSTFFANNRPTGHSAASSPLSALMTAWHAPRSSMTCWMPDVLPAIRRPAGYPKPPDHQLFLGCSAPSRLPSALLSTWRPSGCLAS